jgi:outer membrane protein OmpA-like peptidoglycan-associated protein
VKTAWNQNYSPIFKSRRAVEVKGTSSSIVLILKPHQPSKPESEEQLDNIAEILKAYPHIKKVAGYTDNAGDRRANHAFREPR